MIWLVFASRLWKKEGNFHGAFSLSMSTHYMVTLSICAQRLQKCSITILYAFYVLCCKYYCCPFCHSFLLTYCSFPDCHFFMLFVVYDFLDKHILLSFVLYRPDEAELFAKSAQHIYEQFRNKAAFSRSMTVRFD